MVHSRLWFISVHSIISTTLNNLLILKCSIHTLRARTTGRAVEGCHVRDAGIKALLETARATWRAQ